MEPRGTARCCESHPGPHQHAKRKTVTAADVIWCAVEESSASLDVEVAAAAAAIAAAAAADAAAAATSLN